MAHNHEVRGSSPLPATKEKVPHEVGLFPWRGKAQTLPLETELNPSVLVSLNNQTFRWGELKQPPAVFGFSPLPNDAEKDEVRCPLPATISTLTSVIFSRGFCFV
jgi:hypothetical protein